MRITNNMLVNSMLYYMNNNLTRLQKYQAQLATGKKIEVPSDDPIVAAKALKLRTDVSEVDQFRKNANDAYSWMDITENTLGKTVDILQRARELAVQGSNGTLAVNDREKIQQEITQLRGQAIHLANSTYAGRYIFSGYSTDKKLLNEDGTYNCTVSSNETAAIKGGLNDFAETPLTIDTTNDQFEICLDGTNYRTISLTGQTYDNEPNTINTLVEDIQAQIYSYTELGDVKVSNESGRLIFSLRDTTDANGNKLNIFMRSISGNTALDALKVKTDPVTGMVVSKSEDVDYQIGISDNLKINVLGTELFGSGAKGDAGEFIVSFNRFIDALGFPDDNKSYIKGQAVTATTSNPLDLSVGNAYSFDIKVNGMAAYTTITLPANKYDGTSGNTLTDLVDNIQTQVDADPDLFAAGVTLVNDNGRITFSADNGYKITMNESTSPNNDALKAMKIYTNVDKTVSSFTSNEGLQNSISTMEALKDKTMSMRSDIGARMNRAELTLNRLDNDDVNFTKLMSDNEDVDMAEAIMNLKNEENVYRASLSGGARIIMPTLVDFLK